MKLLMISHKETWCDSASSSGWATVGGFPYHVSAISSLFNQTTLIVALRKTTPPSETIPLTGHNLTVRALPEPYGSNLLRKVAMLLWIPGYLPIIWKAIDRADAVHIPVPSDVGTIGLLVALLQRKPLFVRHCGTWGQPVTLTDRFLLWLLESIAGGKNVVFATGGSDRQPSAYNPHIEWIFSTTLTSSELENLSCAKPWAPGQPLRLITVCRLSKSKNVQAIIQALPQIAKVHPNVRLDILGDGEYRPELERLMSDLNLHESVVLHGNVNHDNVLKLLTQAHLFIFPTQVKEGFPKAVLEALACGLPVVASNVSVIPLLIQDCGYVLEAPTAENVISAILGLLKEPAHLARLSENARERARDYTLEAWQAQIANQLQSAWKLNLHEHS